MVPQLVCPTCHRLELHDRAVNAPFEHLKSSFGGLTSRRGHRSINDTLFWATPFLDDGKIGFLYPTRFESLLQILGTGLRSTHKQNTRGIDVKALVNTHRFLTPVSHTGSGAMAISVGQPTGRLVNDPQILIFENRPWFVARNGVTIEDSRWSHSTPIQLIWLTCAVDALSEYTAFSIFAAGRFIGALNTDAGRRADGARGNTISIPCALDACTYALFCARETQWFIGIFAFQWVSTNTLGLGMADTIDTAKWTVHRTIGVIAALSTETADARIFVKARCTRLRTLVIGAATVPGGRIQ
jgi:hypothetical protein